MGYASRMQSPKPQSRQVSRPQSRQVADDEDDLLTYGINFSNLDQLIAERLEKFSKMATEEIKNKYPLHNARQIAEILVSPKFPVPSEDREMLLNQLYTLVVKSPDSSRGLFQEMCRVFKVSQGYERLIAIRIVAAAGIAQCDDVTDEVIEFLSYLEGKISSDDLDNPLKEQYVYAYSAMTLSIYEGSGAFGIDNKLHFLTETLLGLNADVEGNSDVISALLYGIGGIFTLLLNSSTLNEELETFLESSMDYVLHYELLKVQRPMAMLIGLAYETFHYIDDIHETDYDMDDELQPYDQTYLVEQRLQELVGGSKGNRKNDKLDSRSVFREALHTVKLYSVRANRTQMGDKSYDSSNDEQVLTHIRLSKTRSIAVKSWVSLFRLVLLKWTFGVGLYNQLGHSSELSTMVQYTATRKTINKKLGTDDDDINQDEYHENSHKSNVKKQKEIANKRMEKLNDQLEQTGLRDD